MLLMLQFSGKVFGTLLKAPRVEARGAATPFWQLLAPFVRKGLIEGVYWLL